MDKKLEVSKVRRKKLAHQGIVAWIIKILAILAGLRVILSEAVGLFAAVVGGR